jgi:hypothetical protein
MTILVVLVVVIMVKKINLENESLSDYANKKLKSPIADRSNMSNLIFNHYEEDNNSDSNIY